MCVFEGAYTQPQALVLIPASPLSSPLSPQGVSSGVGVLTGLFNKAVSRQTTVIREKGRGKDGGARE